MGDPVTKMVTGLLPDGTLIRACEVTFEYFKKQEERIAKLKAALREIAYGPHDVDASYAILFGTITTKARKALEGKDDAN